MINDNKYIPIIENIIESNCYRFAIIHSSQINTKPWYIKLQLVCNRRTLTVYTTYRSRDLGCEVVMACSFVKSDREGRMCSKHISINGISDIGT